MFDDKDDVGNTFGITTNTTIAWKTFNSDDDEEEEEEEDVCVCFILLLLFLFVILST